MQRFVHIIAISFGLVTAAATACASSLDSLDRFLHSCHSLHAEFTQAVTAPASAGQTAKTKSSSGYFEFSRPGRFRFVYQKPYEQWIVADGQTLWVYDADLNQVSSRPQAQALGATPAALVAGASDRHALEHDFALQALADQDGLQWVLATPKDKEAQLQSVRLGLKVQGAEVGLSEIDILDSFGQRSVLQFSKVLVNTNLAPSVFQFKPPSGATVLAQ